MAQYLTGNEIIDELQGLQQVVDQFKTVDQKIDHIRKTIPSISTQHLIGQSFMISTSLAFGREADMSPDSTRLFKEGMMFSGEIKLLDYLDYPNIPLDSLAVGVDTPAIFTRDPMEQEAFSRLCLRIPVLAIDTCVSLEL